MQPKSTKSTMLLAVVALAALVSVSPHTISSLRRGFLSVDYFFLIKHLFIAAAVAILFLDSFPTERPGGEEERPAPLSRFGARQASLLLFPALVIALLAGALPRIMSHRSDTPVILGRYGADFFLFLLVVIAALIAAGLGQVFLVRLAVKGKLSGWLDRTSSLRGSLLFPLVGLVGVGALWRVFYLVNRAFSPGRYLVREVELLLWGCAFLVIVLFEPKQRVPDWLAGLIEVGAIAGFLALAVLAWLNYVGISPDSTFYLAAARNLVTRGELVVYTNFPSWSLEPALEPFTEWPPGFPLLLTPFVALFRNPAIAAVVAQCVLLVLLYLSIYLVARALRFPLSLRLLLFVFITLLDPFEYTFLFLWSETPFIILSLGVIYCSVRFVQTGKISFWMVGAALAAYASLVRFIGLFNFVFLFVPALSRKGRDRYLLGAGALLATGLPVGLWFARNSLLIGNVTESHMLGRVVRWQHIFDVSDFLYEFLPSILVVLTFVAMTAPLFMDRDKENRIIQLGLAGGALAHFFGLVTLAVIAEYGGLRRVGAPMLVLWLVAAFNGINRVFREPSEAGKVSRISPIHVASILLLGGLLLSPGFTQRIVVPAVGRVNYPVEMYLWRELEQSDVVQRASHFYSGGRTIHQVFCDIPQRIITPEMAHEIALERADGLEELLAKGASPFFLISVDSDLLPLLEAHYRANRLEKVAFPEYGYVLYYAARAP